MLRIILKLEVRKPHYRLPIAYILVTATMEEGRGRYHWHVIGTALRAVMARECALVRDGGDVSMLTMIVENLNYGTDVLKIQDRGSCTFHKT